MQRFSTVVPPAAPTPATATATATAAAAPATTLAEASDENNSSALEDQQRTTDKPHDTENSQLKLAPYQRAVKDWSLDKVVQPHEDIFDPNDLRIKEDIVRMIAQYLGNEGFHTSKTIILDQANIKAFEREENAQENKRMCKAILDGDWPEVDKLCLRPLVRNQKSFVYAAYKQQYLEYIEQNETQKREACRDVSKPG
eukprot:jgi/Hompol1/6337/HPOL_001505-RA